MEIKKLVAILALALAVPAVMTTALATISSTTEKVSYSGNGATVNFSVTFPFTANSDLQVYDRDESVTPATETLKTITTHYTITGGTTTDGLITGATVHFLVAPATSHKIIIRRVLPLTQTTDYIANGPFPATSHELALDKLVMTQQEFNERLGRAILTPVTSTATPPIFPDPVADDVVGWNAAGTQLENKSPADLGIPIGSLTPVNITSPSAGQYLSFDGTNWVNSALGAIALNSAHLLIGNGSNIATDTAMSGDVTITNAGVTTVDATNANTASKIVKRDASGNFSAGTITAALTGNVTGNLTGNVTGAVTGNSSTATALAANPTDCAANNYATTIDASGT
jgi:hypothetical protein